MRENPVETEVYSNAPALLSLHVGGPSAYPELPMSRPVGRILDGRDRAARDTPRMWFAHAGQEGRVVWLDGMAAHYDYGAADLAALPGVSVSGTFADGAVLSLRKEVARAPQACSGSRSCARSSTSISTATA